MKETYRIKPPKHINIGDPWYYEKYQGTDLQRLTVDFLVPRHLSSARVVIEETPFDDMPEVSNLNMTICLAPRKTIDTYLGGMYYGNRVLEQELADVVLTAAKQMALVAVDALAEVDNKKSEAQTKVSELKKKIMKFGLYIYKWVRKQM